MRVSQRKLLMGSLLSAFVLQTGLVYSDDTAYRNEPLSELALAGRATWHEHNCQACHQIYGFGGFLGPDLTNAMARLPRARLDSILTVGSGQMPAFDFDAETIDGLEAYLRALDATGRGQARRTTDLGTYRVLGAIEHHAEESGSMGESARKGFETFRQLCVNCHTPFQATRLTPHLAADLSDVSGRLSRAEILEVIEKGRPLRGMIPPPTTPEQREEIADFFDWLGEQTPVLRPQLGEVETLDVPWWEFK